MRVDGASSQHGLRGDVRDRIVQKLSDGSLFARYRLRVDLRASLGRVCIDDAEGDSLDAVLAAVQAAWSWVRRDEDYGVPQDCIVLRAGSSIR